MGNYLKNPAYHLQVFLKYLKYILKGNVLECSFDKKIDYIRKINITMFFFEKAILKIYFLRRILKL